MRRFVQTFASASGFPADLPEPLARALAAAPDRYNIGARQPAAVLWCDTGGAPALGEFIWGLVPRWSKTATTRYTTVTARLERAARSRICRHAWEQRQRCVLPLTGYYKWDRSGKPHRPWFIHARNGEVLLAAGLWERWEGDGGPLHSFTVLTQPNAAIPPPLVPDGPVFLMHDRWRRWLGGAGWFPQAFLQRAPQPELAAYPVSRAIRDPSRDDYMLLEPVAADEPLAPDEDASDEEEDDD
jgi:putative SOS response-associated peptidase YedK